MEFFNKIFTKNLKLKSINSFENFKFIDKIIGNSFSLIKKKTLNKTIITRLFFKFFLKMIPAGYEKPKANGKFIFNDSDIDDFGDEEEDEGFVFDFVEKSKATSGKLNSLTLSNTNTYDDGEDWDRDDENSQRRVKLIKNTKLNTNSNQSSSGYTETTNRIQNKFVYNEKEIILKDLHSAIVSNNLERVISIIETNKLDVNSKLKSDWIPLMYSVAQGNYEITKYLIDNGADINFEDGKLFILICTCNGMKLCLEFDNFNFYIHRFIFCSS